MSKSSLHYYHSVRGVPRKSGTYWVKANDKDGNLVTVCGAYAENLYQETQSIFNKPNCQREGLDNYFLEVVIDQDN